MTFHSILFKRIDGGIEKETQEPPIFFTDLNLDRVVETVTAGRQEYDLKPFFYTPLSDVDEIMYRHEIFMDIEDKGLFGVMEGFAEKMRRVRQHLALVQELDYKYHKEGWFLEAVRIYCDAIECLVHDLTTVNLKSRGLLAFREYLTNYVTSERFMTLQAETKKLKADLSTVKYCVLIKDSSVTVSTYESGIDYSAKVEGTFEKFKQGAVKDYRAIFPETSGMNHVEARILDLVAKLYPHIRE